MQTAQYAGQHRPQQCPDDGREPAAERRHGIAGGAVNPEQDELIAGQQGEYGQALRKNREYSQAQPEVRRPRGRQRERERVLTEHHAVDQ
jgi:hypothetical protein